MPGRDPNPGPNERQTGALTTEQRLTTVNKHQYRDWQKVTDTGGSGSAPLVQTQHPPTQRTLTAGR